MLRVIWLEGDKRTKEEQWSLQVSSVERAGDGVWRAGLGEPVFGMEREVQEAELKMPFI